MKRQGRGWFRHPREHSLARKGIKTKTEKKRRRIPLVDPSLKMYYPPARTPVTAQVNWDYEIDIPIFDASIRNQTNPNRTYDCKMVWMPPDDYIQLQEVIFSLRGDKNYTPEQLFWGGVSQQRVEQLKGEISSGKKMNAFSVEFNKEGHLLPHQEGRHRIVAMKEMGIDKVPVWYCKRRF